MNKNYSMEKLNEINSKSFEERTNYIIEDLINPKTNYFKESKDENILNVRYFIRYFTKIPHIKKGIITGYALNVPAIKNLACLNVNINKYISEEESKKASDELFELISKFNFSHVVKTASGGAHIYCNVNNFDMKGKEFYMVFAEVGKYKFDLFGHDNNLTKHKNNYVLLYGSKIKHENSGKILEHKLVIGNPKKPVEPSLEYVLKCFEIEECIKNRIQPKVFTNYNKTVNETRKHTCK